MNDISALISLDLGQTRVAGDTVKMLVRPTMEEI